MTFVARQDLAALIQRRIDITVKEALAELDVPLSLVPADIDPEDWFIISHRLAWGGTAVPAAPGFVSHIEVRNSALVTDRRSLVVVERIYAGLGAQGELGFFQTSPASLLAGTISIARFRDSQNLGASPDWLQVPPIGQIQTRNNNAANFGTAGPIVPQGTQAAEYVGPWVLGNQCGVGVRAVAVNLAAYGMFFWREFELAQEPRR